MGMNALEIGGERYIKASDAAALTGYVTDYIGQLSRSGKIAAERVGRVWYVREADVLEHKKGKTRSNKQKTQESLKKELESSKGRIDHVFYDPTLAPEYRKRLLAADIRYEKDQTPLTPTPIKHEEAVEQEVPQANVAVTDDAPEEEPKEQVPAEEMALDTSDEDVSEEENEESVVAIHTAPTTRHTRERSPVRLSVPVRKSPVEASAPVISHIPMERQVVPRKESSYALTFVKVAVPVALIASFIFLTGGVFLEKTIVYEKGKSPLLRPSYESSYGVRAISAVKTSFSR